jgi:hypothetical protein
MLFTGLALLTFGGAVGVWVVAHTLGTPVASTGSVLLAALPILAGTHFLIGALILDIQESPDRPSAPTLNRGRSAP